MHGQACKEQKRITPSRPRCCATMIAGHLISTRLVLPISDPLGRHLSASSPEQLPTSNAPSRVCMKVIFEQTRRTKPNYDFHLLWLISKGRLPRGPLFRSPGTLGIPRLPHIPGIPSFLTSSSQSLHVYTYRSGYHITPAHHENILV